MELSQNELIEKLYQQIGFIDKSLQMVICGDMSEVLRIATALRVLLHHTDQSSSLFNLLGISNRFWFFDNRKPHNPKNILSEALLVDTIFDSQNIGWKARGQIDSTSTPKIKFEEWWKQPVITCGHFDPHSPYSRRDIILKLTNWEGGAHVGKKIKKSLL